MRGELYWSCVAYDVMRDIYYAYVVSSAARFLKPSHAINDMPCDKLTALVIAAHMAIKQTEDKE
jgi:hypothetical protein